MLNQANKVLPAAVADCKMHAKHEQNRSSGFK